MTGTPISYGGVLVAYIDDDVLAELYTRAALLPDDEFLRLDDGRPDGEIAQHFNVPGEQVAAKRYDLFLRPVQRGASR